MKIKNTKSIILTIDVEDWFQVENFKDYIPFSSWSSYELRVETNTHKILNILDSFSFRPKATFFVLGWIAERMPQLVREIQQRGHEVASHGFNHHLPTKQLPKEFLEDLIVSKKMLEDITGQPIYGYRAPSFAVNNDILYFIKNAGYLYDSSLNSFAMHDRYGIVDLSGKTKKGVAYKLSDEFYELPVSNLQLNKFILPLGGGGYFRLLPFSLFKQGMKTVLKREKAFLFYSHPWEFDPNQPRVNQALPGFKFRHCVNLHRTKNRLNEMIDTFSTLSFLTCVEYLLISYNAQS